MDAIRLEATACRACHRPRRCRLRGLCHSCYEKPWIRCRFESISKHGRRGVGHGNRGYRLPDNPTNALPGSPEKIAVLASRASLGLRLWHPGDRRFPTDFLKLFTQGEDMQPVSNLIAPVPPETTPDQAKPTEPVISRTPNDSRVMRICCSWDAGQRMKAAADALGRGASDLFEEAIEQYVDQLEKTRNGGKPFPPVPTLFERLRESVKDARAKVEREPRQPPPDVARFITRRASAIESSADVSPASL